MDKRNVSGMNKPEQTHNTLIKKQHDFGLFNLF